MDNLDTKPASINDFEQAVLSRNYEEAEHLIVKLIKLYGKDKITLTLAPFDRKLSPEQADLESYQVLEKLAYTLTIWFSDPNWQPSNKIYQYLAMQKHFINSVFAASSYHSTDHIVKNLGLLGKSNYSVEEIKRILLVFTIESDIDLPWSQLLQHLPNETAQAITGLNSSISLQLSKRAEKNISVLLNIAENLSTLESREIKNYGPLLKAFFNCSSLAHEKKYNLKKWISESIQLYVEKEITPTFKKRLKKEVKKKPFLKDQKILFVHEQYKSGHAMYRCFHSLIKATSEKYTTVGLSSSRAVNQTAKKDFDQYYEIEGDWKISKFVETILDIRPDIIIYPSIGMSEYAPFLGALRLAPIQVVLPGHPSSSYLDNIDYMIMPEEGFTEDEIANIFTEKWIKLPKKSGRMAMLGFHHKEINKSTNVINIAVNGVIQKVSHELVSMCVRLSQRANVQVKFHFFMASPNQDIEYFAAKSMLRRFLPNAELYPFTSYQNYMDILSRCNFAIATFPFGGSNSNIDLIRLGIPKLFVKDTNDIPGIADVQIWEAVNEMSGYCESVQHLEERALELIHHPEELKAITDRVKSIELDKFGLINSEEENDSRLVDAISNLLAGRV